MKRNLKDLFLKNPAARTIALGGLIIAIGIGTQLYKKYLRPTPPEFTEISLTASSPLASPSANATYSEAPNVHPTLPPTSRSSKDTSTGHSLLVHIAGQVAHPGVYPMPAGTRAKDILQAAGGPLPDADLDQVNLAALVKDGQRIEIPRQSIREMQVSRSRIKSGMTGGSGVATKSEMAGKARVTGKFGITEKPTQPPSPIRLNDATAADLTRLPGIGPKTAKAIVDYRSDNGPFTTLSDLKKVKGIGPKALERLTPLLSL